jgi:hypothetical protein
MGRANKTLSFSLAARFHQNQSSTSDAYPRFQIQCLGCLERLNNMLSNILKSFRKPIANRSLNTRDR